MKKRTWLVLDWSSRTSTISEKTVDLVCDCGREAECPTSGEPDFLVIGRIGRRGLLLDPQITPPIGWMPDSIRCRKCGREFV